MNAYGPHDPDPNGCLLACVLALFIWGVFILVLVVKFG